MQRFVYASLIAALCACGSSSNKTGTCGDGTVDMGEQCDHGANNGTAGDTCSAQCTIVQAATCGDGIVNGSEECDDGAMNGTPGAHCSATCTLQAYTTASWAIKNVAGTIQACPTNFDTAALYSQALDATGQPTGQPIVDLFNCADGTGVSAPLPVGMYQTWVAITDTTGANTYAQSLSATVDLTTSDKTFTADIYTDGGYFQMAWTFMGGATGNTLTCADLGADSMKVDSNMTTGVGMFEDLFTCSDGRGVTSVLPTGNYDLTLTAFDSATMMSKAVTTSNAHTIQAPNKVTDLGTIIFTIIGQ